MILALASLALLPSHRWSLAIGGDIMLNGLAPNPRRLAAAAPIFKKATVAMANLEVPLTDSRTPTIHKTAAEVKARTQYILKADPRHAKYLVPWGFKVLTQGNNHAMDYRGAGIRQELGLLDDHQIKHTGAGATWKDAWTPVDFPLPGGDSLRIGAALAFMGAASMRKCTPATKTEPGVATLLYSSPKALRTLISRLRNEDGPVILYLHWGTERMNVPRQYQVTLGRACIDAGADAVIGAHPHVFQGAELYHGKPIIYSMGNLISPAPGNSGIAELRFDGRKFLSFTLHPLRNVGGVLVNWKAQDARHFLDQYKAYGEAIQKAFPNPDSTLLPGS